MPRKFNISISGTPRAARRTRSTTSDSNPRKKEIDSGRRSASTCASAAGSAGESPASPARWTCSHPGRGVRRRPRVRRIVPRPRRPAGLREEPLALLRRRSRHRVDPRPARRGSTSTPICGPPARTSATSTRTTPVGPPRTGSRTTPASTSRATEGGTRASASQSVGCRPRKRSSFADLADEYGSGEVRLTRRQNPIIVDVNSDRVDELLAEPLLAKHRPEPNRFVRGRWPVPAPSSAR